MKKENEKEKEKENQNGKNKNQNLANKDVYLSTFVESLHEWSMYRIETFENTLISVFCHIRYEIRQVYQENTTDETLSEYFENGN